jgi:hypothetical protein
MGVYGGAVSVDNVANIFLTYTNFTKNLGGGISINYFDYNNNYDNINKIINYTK